MERVSFEGQSYSEIIHTLVGDWLTDVEPSYTTPRNGLWRLRQQLFTRQQLPELAQESVVIIPCTSTKQEVTVVGKLIKSALLESPELKPSQIAVISRDLQSVQPLIQEVFGQQSLPLALRASLRLSDTPMARQLSALLQMELTGWHRDELLKLYDGNYMDWGVSVPGGLVRWIKQKGIVEGKAGWLQAVQRDLEGLQQRLAGLPHDHTLLEEEKTSLEAKWKRTSQNLRMLAAWFEQIDKIMAIFPKQGSMEEMLQAAKEWLKACGIYNKLAENIKHPAYDRQWLKRDMQSWNLLQKSLESLQSSVTKMREQERNLSFASFVQEWVEHWNEASVLVEVGDPEGIACFEPSAARGLQFKQVYILGCNDGGFPISHRENWLLDDQERQLLGKLGNLPASHHHNEMEQIFFLMAASLTEERLVCTLISPEANEKMLVSPFLEALEKILPDYKRRSVNDYQQWFKEIASPKEYALWLMQKGKEAWQGQGVALYRSNWLARSLFQHVLEGVRIEHDRAFAGFTAWEGNLGQEKIQQLLKEKFSTQVKYSVSQINEYISSPLTFFFKRVLRVQPMDETGAEVSALDKGQILHEVLRKFFTNHLNSPLKLNQLPQYQAEMGLLLQEEAARFAKGTIHEESPLWGFEVERMIGEMEAWLAQEMDEQGACKPRFLEFSFGLPLDQPDRIDARSQTEEIIVPLGEELLRLYGKIDRIDLDEQGHFRILDYKLSLSRYSDYKELADQTVTYQLPLYLAAIAEWLRANGVEDPQMVGGGFYSLRKKEGFKKVGMWDEEKRDLAGISKRARKGVFSSLSEQIRSDLEEVKIQLDKLRVGDFFLTTRQKPNEYYADNAIFRYNPIYLRHKEKIRGRIGHAADHSN
nr:PD-(D/E)XK nuclease family protein [Ammoniphilus resinae]